jgi:hypothetical protein
MKTCILDRPARWTLLALDEQGFRGDRAAIPS